MRKEYRYIAIIFAGFIGALWFAKPLRAFLDSQFSNKVENLLIAGIVVRFAIVLILLFVLFKWNLRAFNGLGEKVPVMNLHALIIPTSILLMGAFNNWDDYANSNAYLLILFAISVLLVGLAEEISFRGLILPLFIRTQKDKIYAIHLSVLFTALLFGVLHYVNLAKEPNNFWGITRQAFFATSIGVFLGGLFLRTGSIIIVSVFHALVNFSFGTSDLKEKVVAQAVEESSKEVNWNSIIPTTILFAFIFISGFYMINHVDKEAIKSKLDNLRLKNNARKKQLCPAG